MPAPTVRSAAWSMVVAPILGSGLAGQQWLASFDITPRNAPAIAYDAARAQTVLFGGYTVNRENDETWLFDGATWRAALPANRPAPRSQHALAYDVLRNRTVLFGGVLANNVMTGDTWEFDGTNWTAILPPHAPSARRTAMVYDRARGRAVLFGGEDTALRNDTWVWDGSDWTQVATATTPWARRFHALAYDSVRARTVLFGGDASIQTDTFEFDGVDWTQVATPNAPPPRRLHGMAFDPARGRVVLFGGISPNAILGPNLADTWEYDGTNWTQITPSGSPTPQWTTNLAYDDARQRIVLFGNGNGGGTYDRVETWTYDGAAWASHSPPSARDQPAFVDDTLRGRTVMFGGQNSAVLQDTWEHDGTRWQRIATSAPLSVAGAAMAFDPNRARTVLFGGAYLWATYDQTWEYDGATWSSVNLAVRPLSRTLHAMTYDRARRRVVLFGGQTGAFGTLAYLNDTWEYDGSSWQQITPTSILPAARSGTAMVFETARSRILMFGGTSGGTGFSGTWVFDGSAWVQLAPTLWPPPRYGHGLAYDALRGRTLLFGGSTGTNTVLADTWEFDGTEWSLVTMPVAPVGRTCSLVFQQHTGRVLSFGGLDGGRHPLGETILFVPAATATFTRHGRGCAGSAGIPVLDTVPPALPALGTNFPLRLSGLPAAPGFALLAFGFDLVRWNGAPLPLDLAAFGLPGCDLWIGPEPGQGVLVPYAGTATHSIALPAAPALAGLAAGAQAIVFDAGAPSGLGAVTNAGILLLQ